MADSLKDPALSLFKELIRKPKKLDRKEIELTGCKKNTDWLTGKSNLSHPSIKEALTFEVRVRNDRDKFALNLHARFIVQAPCFRFDSRGATHTNSEQDLPLSQRAVATPHFQKYDESGRWLAYHTEALQDEAKKAIIQKDVEMGVAHFCQECLIDSDNGFPSVVYQQASLFSSDSNPHNGANFA